MSSPNRQRLLRIGSSVTTSQLLADGEESSPLNQSQITASYGTLPSRRQSPTASRTFRQRHNLPALPDLTVPRVTSPGPTTPSILSPASYRALPSAYFRKQRPISAYDAPLVDHASVDDDLHAKTNGIRVWYSSFSSIDWLHDAIKDSIRFSRIRRGKSIRSKLRLLMDKCIGWVIVTLVGFLTAVVAFLVVRGEQWFFDSKEGYCRTKWTRGKRWCCPNVNPDDIKFPRPFTIKVEGVCPEWRTWAEALGAPGSKHMVGFRAEAVQYIVYTMIAVCRTAHVPDFYNLKSITFSFFWHCFHVY